MTVLSLLPLTLALGMPFPAALRLLQDRPRAVASAWAVNGVASVVGSVASVLLALTVSYEAAFTLAVACYGVAGLAARSSNIKRA